MVRESDHRHAAFKSAIPPRKGKGQLVCKHFGVLAEHLVKVSQTHGDNSLRVFSLNVQIFLIHGRGRRLLLFSFLFCDELFFCFADLFIGRLIVLIVRLGGRYARIIGIFEHIEHRKLRLRLRFWRSGFHRRRLSRDFEHGCLIFGTIIVVKRAFDGIFLEVMHCPTVHDVIIDTGRMRAFFGLLFRLVTGKFHKACKRLFVYKRFTVLLNVHAVVYLFGKGGGSVRLQVCFDFLFFFRRCCKV